MCTFVYVHVYVHSGCVSWVEGVGGGKTGPPSAFRLIEGKRVMEMSRDPPVGHIEEG